ncbi:MAG: hypothetical protein P4L20_10950 [Acidimicrobiales bacterium]|nr:hypothetical protein [Acidimicrobiales bacterium]
MEEPTGRWYSCGPGGPSEDLPADVRQELLRRKEERGERRGPLLARVDVYVWENGEADPQVSFPPTAVLSVEDRDRIADVVRIARDALADWR